jgi:outer membrane protein OmpA-like peptidoglycan-associated protein
MIKTSLCTLLLITVFSFTSCSRAKDLFTKEWNDYETKVTPIIQPMKQGLTEIEEKLQTLNQEKLNHPLLRPMKEKTDAAVAEYSRNLRKIESLYDNEKRDLIEMLETGKIEEAKNSFMDFRVKFDAAIQITKTAYENARKEYDALNDRLDHRESMIKSFAYKLGKADFRGIDFKPNRAEFDLKNSLCETTLTELVRFAKTCPELRFEIIGHTSRERLEGNDKLSLARAEVVRSHLLRNGVSKNVITETIGKGYSNPIRREPEPNSPEEKSMDQNTLESIRAQNRRIEIRVKQACKNS